MELKIKLAPGAQVAYTSTGRRFLADADGTVKVEENTQDHYDLLAQGGTVDVPLEPEDAKQDDGPEALPDNNSPADAPAGPAAAQADAPAAAQAEAPPAAQQPAVKTVAAKKAAGKKA